VTNTSSKICVAICNYNHSKYLERSLRSIVEQDYENLDIVVVDDGSSDQASKDIVDSFSDLRIRHHRFEQNRGKWNGLNYAFSTTQAEICTAHDADDISLPWRLSSQLAIMQATKTAHNLCGFVHCWKESDVAKGLELSRPESMNCLYPDDVARLVATGYQAPGCNHYYTGNFETAGVSAMFLKRVWDIGFRFNPPGMGLRVLLSEDSDFNCRVTLGLRSTSILAETPYLYRRNTSTNKEEK
jgi:glycosyltransferase involved in cell wall biosynthesis